MNNFFETLFKILRISDSKKKESVIQFIKFGFVGVSNVVVSYIINIIVLLALKGQKMEYDYLIANAVSFLLSVLWSFYWNNKFVFVNENNDKKTLFKRLFKTYLSYSFSCIVLNSILSILWVKVLHISKYIAPMINLIVTIPVNFILNKIWAFKK